MKKNYNGWCPRCGETTVGIKNTSWSGGGRGARAEKKGNIKCLSCGSCIGVKVED